MGLIEFTDRGLYCPVAEVYIDPWKPVNRAIITHAHADHAYSGHKYYLAHQDSKAVLKHRLGHDIAVETLEYNEKIFINQVQISLHPAGHILGSSQIRLEHEGEIWVVSGDYKLADDGFSTPFEPIKCHAFVTESTFGLPVYHWKPQSEIISEINHWWYSNQSVGKASLISAYSLGKAQRILTNINLDIGPVFLHGAIYNTHQVLIDSGVTLPYCKKLTSEISDDEISRSLVVAPPSASQSTWIRRLKSHSNAIASGWMGIRGMKRRRAADRGFIISDHADWTGLNQAVEATQADMVYVTHGYKSAFSRWLRENGIDSREVETLYEGEMAEYDENSTV